jgi:carbon monoxide dehydrogenase subunit G
MPVQQTVDVGVSIESVYNQFTQFEDWPRFMHRVKRVTQEDDCTVSFAVKIWGKTKEFTAKIDTQRPDERIKWKSSQGMTHIGVVSFHELGPSLTRIILSFDVDPGGLVEKFARGARHVKRAARGDLHRLVALIETAEHETGAWRGVIEHGEVVEEHDPGYDEQREYSDIEELTGQDDSDSDEDEDEDSGEGGGEEGEEGERDEDQGGGEGEERSPRPRRGQREQRSGGTGRQARGGGGGGQSRRSGRSGSGGSSRRQSRGGSSRRQSAGGSRSGGRSRSSSGSSGGRSRGRGRSLSSDS